MSIVSPARIFFIEMMGVPGSYDASVYDDFEDKDNEGRWFTKKYANIPDITIQTRNICISEPLPNPEEADGFVLAGSYNSVSDMTFWQQEILNWFPLVRDKNIPLLGICGSHQLLGYFFGASVKKLENGPYAGTFETRLTAAGRASPLMAGIADPDFFHFANADHVTEVPTESTLLAQSGIVPVAALDFGDHWYSTQFHPEASAQSLGTIWRNTAPALVKNYHEIQAGDQLIGNFMEIVKSQKQNAHS